MSIHHLPARLALDVAANVRAEVARARVSQQAIADALGQNQQYVSRRITGRVEFRVSELVTIAQLLGIHPAVLLGGRGPGGPTDGTAAPVGRDGGQVAGAGFEPATSGLRAPLRLAA